jgi:hypothetical protein
MLTQAFTDTGGTGPPQSIFDVPSVAHQLLNINITATERGGGLGLAALIYRGQLLFVENWAHATATNASDSLDHYRPFFI